MFLDLSRWVRNLIAAVLCGMPSGACHSVTLSSSFDPKAAQQALEEGSNSIAGRAWLIVVPFGHTMFCGSSGVQLIPVTAYATERMARAFRDMSFARRGIVEALPEDQTFEKNTRRAACDENGNFRFDHVADGKYYLLARIYWQVHFGFAGYGLLQAVSVKGDQKVYVAMMHDFTNSWR